MKKDILRKKTTKTLVTIVFILLIGYISYYLLGNTSRINHNINYEQELFEDAHKAEIADKIEVSNVQNVSDAYIIELKGQKIQMVVPKMKVNYGHDADEAEMNANTTFKEFNNTQLRIIESARNHVKKYVQDSNVLNNKEYLIEKLEEVPFYLYSETNSERLLEVIDAPAATFEHGIYCYEELEQYISEYMLTHELFHYLRYLTSGGVENERYYATPLDEVIADVLAESTGALLPDRMKIRSGYARYYDVFYNYLNVFGEDALEAYFYGYDKFFEEHGGKAFEIEHNIFVSSMMVYNDFSVAKGFLNYWKAQYSES